MSMNLQCKQVDLWQTPTYITYMCYSNGDGGWVGILYRYEQWVRNHINYFTTKEDRQDLQKVIDQHLADLKKHKKLEFFII